MIETYIMSSLREIAGIENVFEKELMKMHTSFRVGGPADVLVNIKDEQSLKAVLKFLDKQGIKPYLMGNGSNLLVRDKGIRGVVIKISKGFEYVEIKGNRVEAGAGILLSKLSSTILDHSLCGFEFASGIPGTLGGAIAMNAGAYGGEMKDVVKKVYALDMQGNEIEYHEDEMDFGYRKSIVQKKDLIVTRAIMEFKSGVKDDIKSIIDDYTKMRTSKQPLSLPSAGSTFKRPDGHFAGKLIQDANLKGFSIGGARVSEKHSGFIVNEGGASAKDILSLIGEVKSRVYDQFGVLLEEEVRIIGEE